MARTTNDITVKKKKRVVVSHDRIYANKYNLKIDYYMAAVVIFIVMFFQLPALVGGQLANYDYEVPSCGNGVFNATDRLCSCLRGYYGYKCDQMYCPRGKSWLPYPQADHVRNMPIVECSNMGICNPATGTCSCRDGFEGRACERSTCLLSNTFQQKVDTSYEGVAIDTNRLLNSSFCSGHGRCLTLRDNGLGFDGINQLRPSLNYDQWDSDMIQGCACDTGWSGTDCGSRLCPFGVDPTTLIPATREKYMLQCQAASGYFSIFARGFYTAPIPYNADPQLLKTFLEAIPGAGRVLIIIPFTGSAATICSASSIISTEITFLDLPGHLSPIFITRGTSQSRQFPDSYTTIPTTNTVLQMSTVYSITCPICTNCVGRISFSYLGSVSVSVDITALGASNSIASAINGMPDFINSNWPNLNVAVTGGATDKICSTSEANTVTIRITSDYGNIGPINILDDTQVSTGSTTTAGLTWGSNIGQGDLVECSNQGICDRGTGICRCYFETDSTSSDGTFTTLFKTLSSDGFGNLGSRGDCGYLQVQPSKCIYRLGDPCSGHGACNNATGACDCYSDWHGLKCQLASCPQGRAWFDEPFTTSEAHQMRECSNMGICDINTGRCACRPGWIGEACDILDCPRDPSTGIACSGHGWCMSTAEIYEMNGFQYGTVGFGSIYSRYLPSTWDAHKFYQCVCSAAITAGFGGHMKYPTVGPLSTVSGMSSGTIPLPGWSGYDCSLRNCPLGDNVDSRHSGGGVMEMQRVNCIDSASTTFHLSYLGFKSAAIFGNMTATSIQRAIEFSKSIGNVTITFPSDSAAVTACSSLYSASSGFYVTFTTEFGDLPLMTIIQSSSNNVNVYEHRKGTTLNLECGGTEMGICNRETGKCMCKPNYGSSDIHHNPGPRGECGYKNVYEPLSQKFREAIIDTYGFNGGLAADTTNFN